MKPTDPFPPRYPPGQTLFAGVLFIGLVGALDMVTGAELSFSIFYLVPVSLLTILNGRSAGLAGSALSAAVWLYADLTAGATYSNLLIPYWNGLVRLGYFSLHTYLLARLYQTMRSERESARVDPLTGAANWRHFRELAEREIGRARRSGHPLTIAYLDVDDFKRANDTLGHDAGDEALRALARAMLGALRAEDVVARVGGDEFIILLPDTGEDASRTVLERVRRGAQREMARLAMPVGISVGAVTHSLPPGDVDQMVRAADAVMYDVKRSAKGGLRVLTVTDGEQVADGA